VRILLLIYQYAAAFGVSLMHLSHFLRNSDTEVPNAV
jgi:hypothetical protein